MSTKHSKAAAEFLKNKKQAAWHDETLWLVRAKRDRLSKEVPEWEELRNMACATKLYSNSHLDELLVEFENNARANGAHVYWAKDADEYCNIVYNILNQHGVKHFIKSKSMLAEECELNPFLESKGIEVVESDLGERILQLMHLKPSHIVLPAIHIKREQVGELFEREMGTEKGNFDPTYLTHPPLFRHFAKEPHLHRGRFCGIIGKAKGGTADARPGAFAHGGPPPASGAALLPAAGAGVAGPDP